MLEEFGVSDLSRDQILTKYTAHHNIKILDKVHNQSQEEYGEQMNDGQLDDDEHKDSIEDRIVFLRLTQKWSLKSLGAKFMLSEEQLKQAFDRF